MIAKVLGNAGRSIKSYNQRMPHEEPEPTPTVSEAARELMREGKVVAPPDLDDDADDRSY